MVRKYKGKKTSVKTAEALARESLKQEEKAENVSAASGRADGSVSVLSVQRTADKSGGCGECREKRHGTERLYCKERPDLCEYGRSSSLLCSGRNCRRGLLRNLKISLLF